MARAIDVLPQPAKVLENKVIVLSRSRVGTFSLFQALGMLGYKPYHMWEVMHQGVNHMDILTEALEAKYQGRGKPYGKAEFDKWLAHYDAIVEIPQWFPEEFIEFYPDAKFILTERDLDAWSRSMNNTAIPLFAMTRKFPLTAIRHIDLFIDRMAELNLRMEHTFYHGYGAESKTGMEHAREDTLKLSSTAKSLIPKNKLVVCQLEDGFGWEEICPFLGKDIPTQKYPKGNAPEEFNAIMKEITAPAMRKSAAIVISLVLVPVFAAAYWYSQW